MARSAALSRLAADTPADTRLGRIMTWHAAVEEARKQLGAVSEGDKLISPKNKISALERAAFGPLPPQADPAWLFTPHPYLEFQRVLLPPEMCSKLLDNVRINRPSNPRKIATLARIMRQGMFYVTNQGLALDVNGAVQDGQNRLSAAVVADFTLDVVMFVGMPLRAFVHLDQGSNRTPANVAQIRGLPNATNLMSTIRLVMQHHQWRGVTHLRLGQLQITNEEYDRALDSPYLPDYQAGVLVGSRARSRMRPLSVSAVGAAYSLLREAKVPAVAASEFVDRLSLGTADPNSPSMKLYRYLNRKDNDDERVPSVNQFGMLVKCWNATVTGDWYYPQFPAHTGELFPEPYPWDES